MYTLAFVGPEAGLGHHVLFGADGETSVHPVVLIATIVAIILMFVVPRKWVVAPLLFLSIMSPLGQRVMVGSFHFQIFRILVIFAWIRLLIERFGIEGQASRIRINSVDKAVIFYTLTCVFCYTLLWQSSAAFFDEVGKSYNVLGFYFAFRFFIRNRKDVERTITLLIFTALPIAAVMLNEQMTGRNILGIFGGVPEHSAIREGYIRSQGPFTVYLTAGAFGATLLPLVLCLWYKRGSRWVASLGLSLRSRSRSHREPAPRFRLHWRRDCACDVAPPGQNAFGATDYRGYPYYTPSDNEGASMGANSKDRYSRWIYRMAPFQDCGQPYPPLLGLVAARVQ